MNRSAQLPRDGAVSLWVMRKNACFAVFLIPNLFFRRTYPEPVPEAIIFSPSAAA